MNACLVVLGLLVGCAGHPPPGAGDGVRPDAARPPDGWFAEDKLRHFTMSFAVTAMGYGAARLALEPDAAAAAAAANALALGLGKEAYDVRSGAWFSVKDLVWDAAGVALGFAFVQRIR